jgi:hypothetical protein
MVPERMGIECLSCSVLHYDIDKSPFSGNPQWLLALFAFLPAIFKYCLGHTARERPNSIRQGS